ncbi:MAG: methyltransferase domain-containing protein [Crocosphaera sp.]
MKKLQQKLLKFNQLAQQKKLYQNPIFRRVFTQNFSSGKIALGERNTYVNPFFPLDWIRVDWQDADYNINLSRSPELPFKDNSQKLLYSAHMIEHLSSESLPKLFAECYRILKPGGRIRLECPDTEKLVNLYRSNDEKMLNHFRKFRKEILIDKFGYPQHYIEDHLSVLGEVSNYIVKGQWVHIPVYVPKQEFDKQLKTLSLDDFCDWCISLQTPEQHKSGGHQSAIYFSKLRNILETAGFTNVTEVSFGNTTIPALKLNGDFWSIKEKPHRTFYSIFVEAEKPC